MFSLVFGIPLGFGALLTGLLLTRVTKWGVSRHRWVMTKLLLILSVILASAYDVLALSLAPGLSVYKPRLKVTT